MSTQQWGPQASGGISINTVNGGRYWLLFALFSPLFLLYRFMQDSEFPPGVMLVCLLAAILGVGMVVAVSGSRGGIGSARQWFFFLQPIR